MPVIANGGYYGAPGVTAAGAYGSTPADMLYSLRGNGWSDQQIMDTYGPDDPMVRIMQLENQWNQAQPSAGGYRYQYPQAAPTRSTQPTNQAATTQPAAQQDTQSTVPLASQQQLDLEQAVANPFEDLPSFGSFSPMYTGSDALFADAGVSPVRSPYQPTYTPYGPALPLEQALEVSRQNIARATPATYFNNLYDAVRGYFGF